MKNDMNDDFLQGLRVAPSKRFLRTLKANLDRQTINQAKARRTLLRTAILAALIGGSAVAVAFAVLRGTPTTSSSAHIITIGPPQSGASNMTAQLAGAGAPQTRAEQAQGDIPQASPVSAAQTRGAFVIAGPTAIIRNAEELARGSKQQPQFTLTSSSEALAMFCLGSGTATAGPADVAGASRRILASELETCKLNGVTHVAEVQSGYETVVLARSKLYGSPKLSARDIFLALAAQVPDPNPSRAQPLIKNPYRTWNAIDSALLEERIEILGPPLSSPTAAAFRQTLMEAGCITFPWLAGLKQTDSKRYEKVCRTLRDDGVYREIDGKLREHLETYPNALALLDFREIEARPDTFAAASVDGIEPRIDTIMAETYAGSRAMFLYVNTEHVHSNPAMFTFVELYRRSVRESWSIATLVMPQRPDAVKYSTPLQEMKF